MEMSHRPAPRTLMGDISNKKATSSWIARSSGATKTAKPSGSQKCLAVRLVRAGPV